MLTSRMTVDEEEAVQKELEQLQAEAIGDVVRTVILWVFPHIKRCPNHTADARARWQ
jgi:hypothetical protein